MHLPTLEALQHKRDIALEEMDADHHEPEDQLTWRQTAESCQRAIDGLSLKDEPLALAEVVNYLEGDLPQSERKVILQDLARGGFLELFDPEALYTKRPHTLTFQGKCYII